MATQLPSLGGGRPGGLAHSASAPRVGPKHKLVVPDFKSHDVGSRIDALGGLRVKRPMGGSSSTPNLRLSGMSGMKPSDAASLTLSRSATPDAPFAQSGRNVPPPSSLPINGTWQSFLSTQTSKAALASTEATYGYPPSKKASLKSLKPSPLAQSITQTENAHQASKQGEVSKIEEDVPKIAHWNFRAMPLETFDMVEDFETRTPEEWMAEVRKMPNKPQGRVAHYDKKQYVMLPCWVHEYDDSKLKYNVELEDGTLKQVKRLTLCFHAEKREDFERRVDTCRARKAACELQESFIAYIDHRADALITPMSEKNKNKFTNLGVMRATKEGETDPDVATALIPVIRELLLEIEQTYVQAAKFFLVKVDLIPGLGTSEACVDENSKFLPILMSFLPKPVPVLGQVDNYDRAELTVPEIIDNLCEISTFNNSSLQVTLHVWGSYLDDVHKQRIFNTTRKDSVDHSKIVLSKSSASDGDFTNRVFELQEFAAHMEEHRDHTTVFLQRKWRDYLIAEVLDRLAEEHNFFVDNEQQHMKSSLHRLLRKFDIMLNTQMRWFVAQSIQEWVDFMRSFIPHPSQCLPSPLLKISLVPGDGTVLLKPDADELIEVLLHMLDRLPETTESIQNIEFKMIPFCTLGQSLFFDPFKDADGWRCKCQQLEDAKDYTKQVVIECLKRPQEVQAKFQEYAYLLQETVTELDPLDIEGTRAKVAAYKKAEEEIKVLSASVLKFPLFELNCSLIIESLSSCASELAEKYLNDVAACIDQRATTIKEKWESTHDHILAPPEDESALALLKEFMAKVDKNVKKPLMAETAEVLEQLKMVEGFFHQVETDTIERTFESFSWPIQIQLDVMDAEKSLDKELGQFKETLEIEKEEFWRNMKAYKETLTWVKGLDDYYEASKVEGAIEKLHRDLEMSRGIVESFERREKLFQIEREDYDELEEIIVEFEPYHKLWFAVCDYKHNEEEWFTGQLTSLNAGEIENTVQDNFNDSYKMCKEFEKKSEDAPAKVAQDFRKEIMAFRKNMPVISALCQKAIGPEHFQQLFNEMDSEEEDPELSELSLQTLLDKDILKHIETVERISTCAQKEYSLKQAMETMKSEWKEMELTTVAYKETGTFLIKVDEAVQALLDDHIIKTQAVRGSPFVKQIEKEVKEWEAKLIYIQDLLESWLMVQRTWLYLEPIFGAEDIVRAMPKEAKDFQKVDGLWRATLAAVVEQPHVLDVADIDGLLANFQSANKTLDQIQKSLNDYLETKRLAFPRFYFLSNEELLMILSQTKDPAAVQPHMGKCFEGINRVRFDKSGVVIEAMISVEEEVVDLDKPVNVIEGDKKGNVEKWLLEVEYSMIDSLTRITGDSNKAYAAKARTEWVLEWPGQVVICVDNIYWSQETAEAISAGKLREYYKTQCDQLLELVNLVRGDLSKLARKTLTAMVTIDVHNRDVVLMLAEAGLTSPKDFDWIAQLRYYWAPKGTITMYDTQKPNTEDKCQVSIINSTLLYGFEYLGNSDRLVVTPLTDRCYRTLMGAFALFYGGAPEGPAGTGKTESTKDLAKALSVQCVVFNCSDGLDYLAMGKFFKGLASSGAWCCFDEFNRINLEVLSVIAQQVATISLAVRARKKTFVFEGTELKLIPTCAVNITMNPGYAGRSELPDNLKALFRPCAMMVPDYALIGEIVLYSFGFGEAKLLAVKAVASLRLGSEQLSSQDHYDFGMRALKSILVAAGQLRRKFGTSRPEAVLMLMALKDVNLPKFTFNDIPLFLGITGDLFPGVELPPSDYGQLINELEGACTEKGLQPKQSFINKCTQLWETIMVRHGLMVVGMNLSGKSQVENVLAAALKAVADGDLYKEVQMHKMNPKSIKQGELYGDFDENTHEWTDGILALTVRFTSNAGLEKRQWIMLDGPVDAVWIENMNTVLDDNKKLCLNSGEIIKLSSVSTMMFEVEDLTVASPATVSRCGMVFMEQVDIGWQVLMDSWCESLPERLQDFIPMMKEMFLANVDQLWEMNFRKIKTPVPPTQNWLVMNLLRLFWALLKNDMPSILADPDDTTMKDIPAKEKEIKIDNIFWLAVIWSFGATTDEEGRHLMSDFIRDIMAGEKVKEKYDLIHDDPEQRPAARSPFPEGGSVYDYYPRTDSNKPEVWTKKITGFDIPKTAQVHTIMVPTADTVRNAFLLQTCVSSEYHILFTGLTGTGKTVIIQQELLKGFDKDSYSNISFAFSAQTTSAQTQAIIDGKLDKRKKGTYGPPLGKKCLVFVDDLNMPTKEIYGAQPPIELLRQWMDTGGWYDRKTMEWRNLIELNFIGAMGPPGAGRPFLTGRYQRHYNLVMITPFEDESLARIFDTVMMWFLGKFSSGVSQLGKTVVKATIDLYTTISKEMRPTPAKSHYTFNLRDLSKVHQGICVCEKESLPAADDLIKCWAHEAHRVFYDRLVSKDDQKWFSETIKTLMKEHFKKDYKSLVKSDTFVWCDFIDSKQEWYQEVTDSKVLIDKVNECLVEYNMMAKRGMDLVVFLSAAEHVCRIARVLKTPLGNCLAVGIGGSGRKSLATLAIFVTQQDTFTIELTKSYNMNEWHDDIKRLLMMAGAGKGKPVTFLLADTQIPNENFLEETSGLLNTGEVPNLFNAEDKAAILEACSKEAEKVNMHGPNEVFAFFVEQCQKNLHIVLALSPIGENFRRRVRMFPSLVNCCTIDWFHEWPDEALQSVAAYFLDSLEMEDSVRQGVVDICVDMQKSVYSLSERFLKEVGRYYYVTPTSYLELINAFKGLLDNKRSEVTMFKSRYDVGLDKIISTEQQVFKMQAELEELKPYLKKTKEETVQLMAVTEKEQEAAKKISEVVAVEAEAAGKAAAEANAQKEDCDRDLAKAIPALEAAIAALKSLKQSDITEVKQFGKPPNGVVIVSKALCWALGVNPKKVTGPDGRTKIDDYWEPAKKTIWGDPKLLARLLEYDKDNIPEAVMAKLKPLETDPEFTPEVIKNASVAACGICKWVHAMITYDEVFKMVGPKKAALAIAEATTAEAMAQLAEKKAEEKAATDKVARLVEELQAAEKKRDDLEQQYNTCSKRLITAEKLINGLGGEKDNWSKSSAKLGEQYTNLTGDILISSGIIAYLGTFLAKYRNLSISSWVELMKAKAIPSSPKFLLRNVVGEEVLIRQWVIDKLPNDQVSIDNALILSKSRRWPLMIDPQIQANQWIRKSYGAALKIMRLTTHNYSRILEMCIQAGDPVLIENVTTKIDPLLEPLLQKAIFKAGNIMMIKLGDSTVEYSKDFKLFLTTKLPNPHYPPELCVQVTLLNFMVTPDGLEDQMLGVLVAKEEPAVEAQRVQLVIDSAASKAQLKETEDKILELLSASSGNILDDDKLITTLAESKVKSQKIEESVKDQEKTAAKVQTTRTTYQPVAVRSSAMFFVIADLNICEPTYQYSLEWFIGIFNLAISTAEKFERNLERRLQALQDKFIQLLYEKVCDSLFEKDKLMYSLLLTLKSMEVDHQLDFEEKALLFVAGITGKDPKPRPEGAWLTDTSWARVCEVDALNKGPWIGFADSFAANMDGWKKVFDSDDPMGEQWPLGIKEQFTPMQKSLALLAVRADCTIRGIQDIIGAKLGDYFLEPPPKSLEKVYNDSNSTIPLIFVLSSGADPMGELRRLAEKVGMGEKQNAVSLGQGQGKKAELAIKEGTDQGMWVILQNCHLSISWMPKLEASVEELDPEKIAGEFRLWLTTMPSNDFPVSVLQNGMKMTVEPPKGLKSNMLRAYLGFDDEWFNEAGQGGNNPKECTHAFRKMLMGLCFFHASIQERSQYGPLGWNIPYQFSEQDREICMNQLKIFLESNEVIPYSALRYTASECNYGGRVTDTHDRRCISTIITDFYCKDILKDSYRYSESGTYYSPPYGDKQSYIEYIKQLPINQAPEAFGLHSNANLSAAIKETLGLLQAANSMAPKSQGAEGGKSPEQLQSEMTAKYLSDVRQPFDMEAVAARYPVDRFESLNTVLSQEMLRFNKLVVRVRASLKDVGLAVKGLVVMDHNLEQVADGIIRNVRPAFWMKVSYPSLKPLSSYVADLCARLTFLTDWEAGGHKPTYWISGFYFTQAFLTGQAQNYARKFTLPIDTLTWKFQVLEDGKKEWEKPETGTIVYGVFMEGARWDPKEMCVAESEPKVLFVELPYMHWDLVERDKDPTDPKRVYMSPLYKTSERKGVLSTTGHSTNFVTLMMMPMSKQHTDKHWIKRGVACLTQLDD